MGFAMAVVICIVGIGLCAFCIGALIMELRAIQKMEDAAWSLWRKEVELMWLIEDDQARADFFKSNNNFALMENAR